MKLIVGLGNPGKEYEKTRHNVGFQAIQLLAKKWGVVLLKEKFEAKIVETEFEKQKVLLALPQTYMNLSGQSVSSLLNYFKILSIDLAVVHDELDLPIGKLKVIREGGAAGNRGVLSIQDSLNTKEFCRFRIGIGKPKTSAETVDFVLRPFIPEEKKEIDSVLKKVQEGLEIWIEDGVEAAIQYCHTVVKRN